MSACRYNFSKTCTGERTCTACKLNQIVDELEFLKEKLLPNCLAETYEQKGIEASLNIVREHLMEVESHGG